MSIAALVAREPLRMGAIGGAVITVQTALRAAGHELQVDGQFGAVTRDAVRAFSSAHGLAANGGVVDVKVAAALDRVLSPAAPSVLKVAPWLATARALTGAKEAPGSKDNPLIIEMAHEICSRYPDLKGNVDWYNHDSIPWCGLFIGYCFAANGVRPSGAPLSALSWASWGVALKGPTPGALLVYSRAGGGHVTFYESEDASYYYCRGGNQSDAVNVARIPKARAIKAIRWPAGVALPTAGRKLGATRDAVQAAREA